MNRYDIITLGCKVNQYDGSAISAALQRTGLVRAARSGNAPVDLVVINTCCVTATAMQKSRQAIRRAVRRAPEAVVLVTGCYSDFDGATITALLRALSVPPGKTFIAGHHDNLNETIRQVIRVLHDRGGRPSAEPSDALAGSVGNEESMSASTFATSAAAPTSIRTRRAAAVKNNLAGPGLPEPIEQFEGHQRAFVKVQDGCDAFCSYCIVPFTRCHVRSRDAEDVLAECRSLVAAGHREIVLCGVFLGAYGHSTAVRRNWGDEATALPGLVRRVAEIEGLWRVRLSSLEPGDLSDELLAAARDLPALAPHFHLPLQSGSETILRRMNRQYSAADFRRAVDGVRRALDRPTVTTDIIVGFPSESEDDFAATLELARRARFAKIHTFPFSPIEGTAAWTFRRETPPADVVKERLARLADLERELAAASRRRFVGETLEALVESPRKNQPLRRAMTGRYQTVFFEGNCQAASGDLTGQVVRLHITGTTDGGLTGELRGPA